MFGILLCLFSIGAEPAQKFAPGDRAAILVDINGDGVGEMLVVESSEPQVEMGSVFDLHIKLTNPRGNILFESDEIGEAGWFSVEKASFEFEGGTKREIALIRTGCSGTGVHVNAILLYQPPKVKQVMVTYNGNEGVYDANGNAIPDVFVSVYRMQNLGVIGASSPWLPTFTRPALSDGWETIDVTFKVLGQDDELRKEWIDGIQGTYDAITIDFPDAVDERHLNHLKMLKAALEANDMEEAKNIYYTNF